MRLIILTLRQAVRFKLTKLESIRSPGLKDVRDEWTKPELKGCGGLHQIVPSMGITKISVI